LWTDIQKSYEHAQNIGAAYSIDTNPELLLDADTGVEFVVRVATALKDKPKPPPKEGASKKEWRNPFLPYEPDLFVRNLPPHHVLLLNKFNVVDHHLLVVTKEFELQTDPINDKDFACVWEVLNAFPGAGGLAFYNCGDASGHSQPHKHMQLVPLPLDSSQAAPPPFENLILKAATDAGCHTEAEAGKIFTVPSLPFMHAVCMLKPSSTAQELQEWYKLLLADALSASESWNLVMTTKWMMIVPRSRERVDAVSLNALGFAGTLLVRSAEELEQVRQMGVMKILAAAGCPR